MGTKIMLAGLAAVIGALVRYGMIQFIDRRFGWTSLKVSTMVINVSGAFLLGLFTARLAPASTTFVFSSGMMGGYTTFSTYMNETIQLQGKHPWTAFFYFSGTLLLGLAGALLGYLL